MTRGVLHRYHDFMGAYWTRGEPGREMPQRTVALLFKLWLVAFLLKSAGATWDISWHFKWFRDTLAWPHNVNLVGLGIAIGGVVLHTFTGYGVDRPALRLLQGGLALFVVAAPLDELNHRVNGLDITTWSPSHFMLYAGTAIMIAGVIRALLVCVEPGRFRNFALLAAFFFFLDNALFPNGQQEYGIMALRAWDAGTPTGEPLLYRFAADQLGQPEVTRSTIEAFALPIPAWFYPVYGILATTCVLIVARRAIGLRWTSTMIGAAYVGYRCVAWVALSAGGFPESAVPFWLLPLCLAIDMVATGAWTWTVRILSGAALVTGVGYTAIALQGALLVAPPVDYYSAIGTFVLLALLWATAERWYGPRVQPMLMARLGGGRGLTGIIGR